MDESDFKEVAQRLKEASKVIGELDPILREDAWILLRPYVAPGTDNSRHGEESHEPLDPKKTKGSGGSGKGIGEDELIEQHESDKESENLYLTLAILYQRYGRGPFTLELIKSVGKAMDLTLPARPDTTLRNSTRKVVRKQDGGYKVQPSGEAWLKETYGVSKGKQALPNVA